MASGWTRPAVRCRFRSCVADEPGQALAYKMGELKIKELRRLAETQFGPRFDVRAFHDALLANGSIPLDVLETEIRRWLATWTK